MEWYRSLATFYWAANEDEESLASDPDRRLLSTVVEKVWYCIAMAFILL